MIGGFKRLFGLALMAGAPLLAKYGDTVKVEVTLNMVIQPGWVIIAKSFSGPQFYSPHFKTTCYNTLKDLNGAPADVTEEILGESPIPAGWSIIQTRGNTGLDKYAYNIRYIIKNTGGAGAGAGAGGSGAPVSYDAPLVYDIAGIDWKAQEEARKAKEAQKQADEAAAKAAAKPSLQWVGPAAGAGAGLGAGLNKWSGPKTESKKS